MNMLEKAIIQELKSERINDIVNNMKIGFDAITTNTNVDDAIKFCTSVILVVTTFTDSDFKNILGKSKSDKVLKHVAKAQTMIRDMLAGAQNKIFQAYNDAFPKEENTEVDYEKLTKEELIKLLRNKK